MHIPGLIIKGLSINVWTILHQYIWFQLLLLLINKIFKWNFNCNLEIITLTVFYIKTILSGWNECSWLASTQLENGVKLFSQNKWELFLLYAAMKTSSVTILVYLIKAYSKSNKIGLGYLFIVSIFVSMMKSIYDSWTIFSLDGLESKLIWAIILYSVIIGLTYKLCTINISNKYIKYFEFRNPGMFFVIASCIPVLFIFEALIQIPAFFPNYNGKFVTIFYKYPHLYYIIPTVLSSLSIVIIGSWLISIVYFRNNGNKPWNKFRIRIFQFSITYLVVNIFFNIYPFFMFGQAHYEAEYINMSYETLIYLVAFLLLIKGNLNQKYLFKEQRSKNNCFMDLFCFPYGFFSNGDLKRRKNKAASAATIYKNKALKSKLNESVLKDDKEEEFASEVSDDKLNQAAIKIRKNEIEKDELKNRTFDEKAAAARRLKKDVKKIEKQLRNIKKGGSKKN